MASDSWPVRGGGVNGYCAGAILGHPGRGTEVDNGQGIAGDGAGGSVVTGNFEGTATFGAGEPNETTLTSAGSIDIFVARYTDGAANIDFETFEPDDQGDRFGVHLGEEYGGLDWAHDTASKIETWGSFTVQDKDAEGGNDSTGKSIPGAGGSENWVKARASSVGKGAKITRLPGECFDFHSMQLYTQEHPAFIDEVTVTWRTCDATTTASADVFLTRGRYDPAPIRGDLARSVCLGDGSGSAAHPSGPGWCLAHDPRNGS